MRKSLWSLSCGLGAGKGPESRRRQNQENATYSCTVNEAKSICKMVVCADMGVKKQEEKSNLTPRFLALTTIAVPTLIVRRRSELHCMVPRTSETSRRPVVSIVFVTATKVFSEHRAADKEI